MFLIRRIKVVELTWEDKKHDVDSSQSLLDIMGIFF